MMCYVVLCCGLLCCPRYAASRGMCYVPWSLVPLRLLHSVLYCALSRYAVRGAAQDWNLCVRHAMWGSTEVSGGVMLCLLIFSSALICHAVLWNAVQCYAAHSAWTSIAAVGWVIKLCQAYLLIVAACDSLWGMREGYAHVDLGVQRGVKIRRASDIYNPTWQMNFWPRNPLT